MNPKTYIYTHTYAEKSLGKFYFVFCLTNSIKTVMGKMVVCVSSNSKVGIPQ